MRKIMAMFMAMVLVGGVKLQISDVKDMANNEHIGNEINCNLEIGD